MRSEDTGKKYRGRYCKMKNRNSHPHTYNKRNQERENPKQESLSNVLLQVLQVHFQAGQEHDVIDTHLTEKFKAAVTFQDIESILANGNPCQNHSDDMGYPQTSQQNRGKKNNNQHQEKDPSRIRYGKMYAKTQDIHKDWIDLYHFIDKFKKKVPFFIRLISKCTIFASNFVGFTSKVIQSRRKDE
jgi:hypothetical protein